MKKFILLSLISFFFIVFAKSATPTFACYNCDHVPTYVAGSVRDQDHKLVKGAQVTVVCAHGGQSNTKSTTTNNFGLYEVSYTYTQCDEKDHVTVTASKNGQTGTNYGIVRELKCIMDIALINIILVPEFGLLTGALAMLGSVGAFLKFRKS